MKKQILLLLVAMLTISVVTIAQNERQQAPRVQMSAKSRAEQMAKNLSLTADQQQKVQALFEAQQSKMKELKAAPRSDQDARREEMKALRQDWNKQLEDIIGKENMAKNKAIMAEKAKRKKSEEQ